MPTAIYFEEPWYIKKQSPVFCNPCRGIYEAMYPVRKPVLIIAVILWIIGIIMLISVIVTCIATTCGYYGGILIPISIIVLWVGYLLFHCAWAAHLLEDDTGLPVTVKHEEQVSSTPHTDGPFQTAYDEEGQPIVPRVGFWQFADEQAWQAVSSRDTLQ